MMSSDGHRAPFFSPTITVGNILSALVMLGGMFVFFVDIRTRIAVIETTLTERAYFQTNQVSLLQNQVTELTQAVRALERKVAEQDGKIQR